MSREERINLIFDKIGNLDVSELMAVEKYLWNRPEFNWTDKPMHGGIWAATNGNTVWPIRIDDPNAIPATKDQRMRFRYLCPIPDLPEASDKQIADAARAYGKLGTLQNMSALMNLLKQGTGR